MIMSHPCWIQWQWNCTLVWVLFRVQHVTSSCYTRNTTQGSKSPMSHQLLPYMESCERKHNIIESTKERQIMFNCFSVPFSFPSPTASLIFNDAYIIPRDLPWNFHIGFSPLVTTSNVMQSPSFKSFQHKIYAIPLQYRLHNRRYPALNSTIVVFHL